MSKLAALDDLLELYYQLNYHQNPDIFQRLQDVQAWQKTRMQSTHLRQFSEKHNILMSEYFLNRLYGGSDFDALAGQIARLMKYAHKAEKIIPENAIKTGMKTVGLAVLAMELDEQVAQQLLKDYPANQVIDDEMMRQTLVKLDQSVARKQQLDLLDELGISLDKYMRSFIMHTAFKMCKGTASKYRFELMYDFIGEGFVAMKPLKSAATFIQSFTAKERMIVDNVHSGKPNPFRI